MAKDAQIAVPLDQFPNATIDRGKFKAGRIEVGVQPEVVPQQVGEVVFGAVFQNAANLPDIKQVSGQHPGIPIIPQRKPSEVLCPIQYVCQIEGLWYEDPARGVMGQNVEARRQLT